MCILVTYCYLRYADDTTLVAESDEELKSLLLWVKEERDKVSFKLNIQKAKIMTSGPITSWQTDREIVEAMTDFIFLGSKITVEGDCCHEIKRPLLLGRIVMTNLDSILKSRAITLLTKVLYTQIWRRQWHPTPALLPGKSHGWRSLVGCSPWGR